MLGKTTIRNRVRMEAMNDNKISNRIKDAQGEENLLKAEYEYLLNREQKIVREKEVLLEKLLKLKAILAELN